MATFDNKVVAFDVPGLPQSSETRRGTAPWVQHAYPVDLPRLLRAGPRRRDQEPDGKEYDEREGPFQHHMSRRIRRGSMTLALAKPNSCFSGSGEQREVPSAES